MVKFYDRLADYVGETPDAAHRIIMLRASWETQDKLREWAKSAGFDLSWSFSGWPQSSYDFDFHVTLVASANAVKIPDAVRYIDQLELKPEGYAVLGKNVPVIQLAADPKLVAMREFFISAYGVKPTFPDFTPHISLSYKWDGNPQIIDMAPAMPDFPLVFDCLMVSIMDPPTVTADAKPTRKILSYADKAVAIAGTRKTADGYIVTEARVARGGNIQDYYGHEIGEGEPNQLFRVYRPADEIFKTDSLATFAHKPVTLGHPAAGVSPDNFRDEAVGHLGSEVIRDGEFVRVPMVVMDGKAIASIENSDAREISMGYDCELVMEPGVTADGRAYDAYQKNIRINHCAIVPAGRAGPQCRIGDQSRSNPEKGKTMTKTVTIDGKSFEVADDVAAALANDQAKATAKETEAGNALRDAAAQLTAASDTMKALKAEVAAKPAADAQAADVHALAAALVATIDTAKKIAPSLDYAGKTAAEVKKMAVTAKVGDAAAKDKDAAYFDAAFDMWAGVVSDADPVRDAIRDGGLGQGDQAKKAVDARQAYLDRTANAHKAKVA